MDNTDYRNTKTPVTAVVVPVSPSSPVQIPETNRETAHHHSHHHHHQRKPRHNFSSHRHAANLRLRRGERRSHSQPRGRDALKPDDVPASVASLLAVTSIPSFRLRQRAGRGHRHPHPHALTVDDLVDESHVIEKAMSLTLEKSPMELLLSAPEDLVDDDDDDEASISTTPPNQSALSTRTVSMESMQSMPSLSNSMSTVTLSSVESPMSLMPPRRRPTRPSFEPITLSNKDENHPLFSPDLEELDFRVFQSSSEDEEEETLSSLLFFPLHPIKSAFKSNLTASLRALRSAAKSFSSLNFTSIPPEDFLTRSLLAIDPQVPYTDERRPPVLETEPPAALRRYLNPTTISREESRASPDPNLGGPATRTFTASIQMQTYKVQRNRNHSPPAAGLPLSGFPGSSDSSSSSSHSTNKASSPQRGRSSSSSSGRAPFSYPPGPRALRENSDFIRVAVMEMEMRRRGKLSDETPGHARLALPPRRSSTQPYDVGTDGVPSRWVPVSVDDEVE